MKYIILIMTFILPSSLTFSQVGENLDNDKFSALYLVTSTHIDEKGKEYHSIPAEFELLYDSKMSQFEYIPKINNRQEEGDFFTMASSGIIFVNLEQNKMYERKSALGKDYFIIDSILKFDWKIIPNEIKSYNTYSLNKAVYENPEMNLIITAYYSEDVKYPFGPNIYGGLPGLIFEIQIEKIYGNNLKDITYYNLIEIKNTNKEFKKINFTKSITYEEYQKLYKEALSNMMEMNNGGVDTSN